MTFSESATPSNVRIENNALKFEWTCPRCGHEQVASITEIDKIRYGTFVGCSNIAVCGEGNSYVSYHGFDFGDVSHRDPSDIPLKDSVAA